MMLRQLMRDFQEFMTTARHHRRGLKRGYLCQIYTTGTLKYYPKLYQILGPIILTLEVVGSWGMMSDYLMNQFVVCTLHKHMMNKICGGPQGPQMNPCKFQKRPRILYTVVTIWKSTMSSCTGQPDMNLTPTGNRHLAQVETYINVNLKGY